MEMGLRQAWDKHWQEIIGCDQKKRLLDVKINLIGMGWDEHMESTQTHDQHGDRINTGIE